MAATSTFLPPRVRAPGTRDARARAAQDAHEHEGGHAEQEAAGGGGYRGGHGDHRGALDGPRLGQDRKGANLCFVLGLGKGGGFWHRGECNQRMRASA